MGFENNSEYESINELDTASTFAKELKSNHTSMIYNENTFEEELLNMVLSMGEPYGEGIPHHGLSSNLYLLNLKWHFRELVLMKFLEIIVSGKDFYLCNLLVKKTIDIGLIKNLFRHRYYLSDN